MSQIAGNSQGRHLKMSFIMRLRCFLVFNFPSDTPSQYSCHLLYSHFSCFKTNDRSLGEQDPLIYLFIFHLFFHFSSTRRRNVARRKLLGRNLQMQRTCMGNYRSTIFECVSKWILQDKTFCLTPSSPQTQPELCSRSREVHMVNFETMAP